MVRIAVAGLGFIGKVHLQAYAQIPGADVVAACDVRLADRRDELLSTEGNIGSSSASLERLELHTSLDDMLAAGTYDVVDVCLPTALHPGATLAAFRAGCHVIVEKPIALTVEDASRMLNAARSADRQLYVCHCIRYWPAYAELAQIIRSRELGELRSALFERYSQVAAWSWNNWMRSEEQSGGPIVDLHIHDTDFVAWVLGPPESVSTTGSTEPNVIGAKLQTLYRYPGATVCACAGLTHAAYPFVMRATCMFDSGVVELNGTGVPSLTVFNGSGSRVPELDSRDGYYHELTEFVQHLHGHRAELRVTPESAIRSLSIVLAERRSMIERRPIPIVEVSP